MKFIRIISLLFNVISFLIILLLITVVVLSKTLPSIGKAPSKEQYEDYRKRAVNLGSDNKFYFAEKYLDIKPSDEPIKGSKLSTEDRIPDYDIKVLKPNLTDFKNDEVKITWLGHSSLFIRMENQNILMDPVFSKHASPISFYGVERYSKVPLETKDYPTIDLVLITHDHYDHLDYKTIKELDSKVKQYIVPLGVENHLIKFGVDESKIKNIAWYEEINSKGLKITATPSRHHSGRNINTRYTTSWNGFFLEDSKGFRVYNTSDGGYGSHFREIHEKLGKVDIILTDNGQYNEAWYMNHMFPEQAYKASQIMQAKYLIPIHIGAYSLSPYPWNDALMRLKKIESDVKVITPMIGETVDVNNIENYTKSWWIKD